MRLAAPKRSFLLLRQNVLLTSEFQRVYFRVDSNLCMHLLEREYQVHMGSKDYEIAEYKTRILPFIAMAGIPAV